MYDITKGAKRFMRPQALRVGDCLRQSRRMDQRHEFLCCVMLNDRAMCRRFEILRLNRGTRYPLKSLSRYLTSYDMRHSNP